MARIVLDHVHKRYANGFVAAHDVSLDIVDGELLVLVGPSGSGKSTLLRMIAGLEPVTSGRILIGGRDVTALPPQERDLAMVFQSYALYPHMTVRQNLAFGLSVRRQPPTIIQERVSTTAESLGLSSLLDRKPGQLSGGQRQRVALGRAIVREPLAFLFDEPLSNLDARLRAETRAELARLHERLGATMVYVTHDQVEAMTLGTRVAVMNGGALQQVAPPMTLYRAPATQFVAGFIGSPAMNFVEGVVRRRDGGAVFEGSKLTLTLGERRIEDARRVVLGLRPQGLSIGGVGRVGGERGDESLDGAVGAGVGMRAGAGAGAGAVKDSGGNPGESWDARVWLVEALGNEQIVHVAAGDVRDLVVVAPVECVVRSGDVVRVRAAAGAAHLFDAATGRVID